MTDAEFHKMENLRAQINWGLNRLATDVRIMREALAVDNWEKFMGAEADVEEGAQWMRAAFLTRYPQPMLYNSASQQEVAEKGEEIHNMLKARHLEEGTCFSLYVDPYPVGD